MPFPDDDATFENVTVLGELRTGVAPAAYIFVDADYDGFGTPAVVIAPAAPGLPSIIYVDPATDFLKLLSGDATAGIDLGGNTVSILTASGGTIELLNATVVNIGGRDILATWTAYTPTHGGITLGASNQQAKYLRVGNTVHFRVGITLAAGFAIAAGGAAIGLPFASTGTQRSSLSAGLEQAGVRSYCAHLRIDGGSSLGDLIHTEAASGGAVTTTAPFVWAVGDRIWCGGTYEAAP